MTIIEVSEFNTLTKAIFDSLNIKKLTLRCVEDKFMKKEFFEKIINCHSLRYVGFYSNMHTNKLLDIIEANPHVKQWVLDPELYEDTKSIKKRLQAMVSNMKDNSLIVYSHDKVTESIAEMTKGFKVSPASYF